MPKFTTTILFALISICSFDQAKGQNPVIPDIYKPQPIFPNTQKAIPVINPEDASITNLSNWDIVYFYSYDSINWNRRGIEPGEIQVIREAGNRTTWFKISTENMWNTYLVSNKGYSISWNREKRLWDLYRIVK